MYMINAISRSHCNVGRSLTVDLHSRPTLLIMHRQCHLCDLYR